MINIEPIELIWNNIVENTMSKVDLFLSFMYGDTSIKAKLVFYDKLGVKCKEREQDFPLSAVADLPNDPNKSVFDNMVDAILYTMCEANNITIIN